MAKGTPTATCTTTARVIWSVATNHPAAETGNFWARLEHERFLSTQTTVTGSSTDHTLGPAQVLTITETVIPPTLPREN